MEPQNNSFFTNLLNEGRYDNHDECFTQEPSFPQEDMLPNQSQVRSSGTTKQKKVRSKNFSLQEDMLLISAWLNVSMDPVQGNNQTQTTYWNRIAAYFHGNKQFDSDRSSNSLMNRWSTIQLAVSKFQGYYNQIDARNQSGVTEQDKICQALEMYKTLQKSAFPFMNCWNELRFSPKFTSNFSKKKAKGSQTASPATSSPSISDPVNMNDVLDNDHALERPTGRKSTKELFRKAKEKA